MTALRLAPLILSCLLVGAHFLRSGNLGFVAVYAILPFLLLISKSWVRQVFTGFLLAAAVVWANTTIGLIQLRQALHEPWLRMALILIIVTLFTAISPLVFRTKALRQRFSDN